MHCEHHPQLERKLTVTLVSGGGVVDLYAAVSINTFQLPGG